MSDEVKELIRKAKSLVNLVEATDFLELAEIKTHGVTNINCLDRRINEVKSAIAAAERVEAHARKHECKCGFIGTGEEYYQHRCGPTGRIESRITSAEDLRRATVTIPAPAQRGNCVRCGKPSIKLMEKILDTALESGANLQEAICALRAAEALLPEAGLEVKPTVV